jgi:hypothetical protein
MRRAALTSAVAAVMLVVPGGAQEQASHQDLHKELAAARLHWATRRPTKYEFVLSIPNGVNDPWTRRFPSFRIIGNQATSLSAGTGELADIFNTHSSIDSLFDLIESEIDKSRQPQTQVWLNFDDDLGYPTSVGLGAVSFRVAAFRAYATTGDVADPFVLIEHVNHCAFGMPDPTDISVCPTYSIAIWGDGIVTYDGGAGVRTLGRRSHRASPSVDDELIKAIVSTGFFRLEDSYASKPAGNGLVESIDHSAEQWITVRSAGRQKTVHDFYGAPKALRDFEAAVERIADSVRYTGRKIALEPLRNNFR